MSPFHCLFLVLLVSDSLLGHVTETQNPQSSSQAPNVETNAPAVSAPATIEGYSPERMLCLVNQERAKANVQLLKLSAKLGLAAQYHSNTQAASSTMTHDDPHGLDAGQRITMYGLSWQSCGENVAFGYPNEDIVMQKWMASPGHRENILKTDFQYFGSAIAFDKDNVRYWTQEFASLPKGTEGELEVEVNCGAGSPTTTASLAENPSPASEPSSSPVRAPPQVTRPSKRKNAIPKNEGNNNLNDFLHRSFEKTHIIQ